MKSKIGYHREAGWFSINFLCCKKMENGNHFGHTNSVTNEHNVVHCKIQSTNKDDQFRDNDKDV